MLKAKFGWQIVLAIVLVVLLVLAGLFFYLSACTFCIKESKLYHLFFGYPTIPVAKELPTYGDSPFGFHTAAPYESAKDIGVKWTRGGESPYLVWSLVQADLKVPSYSFKYIVSTNNKPNIEYDKAIREVPSDINILWNIDVGNHTAPGTDLRPVSEQAYKAFVRAAVERYDGDSNLGCLVSAPDCYVVGDKMYPEKETIDALKINPIKYWQVGNEPGSRHLVGFVDWQRWSYEAIKEADPAAKVVSAGPTGSNDGYLDIIDSFFPTLSLLGGKYFDIYDIHVYGGATGSYRLLDNKKRDIYDYMRSKLTQAGFSKDLPIWMTETCTYSGTLIQEKTGRSQTEGEQALDLVKRYVYNTFKGIEKTFWVLNIVETTWDSNPNHSFSMCQLIYDGAGVGDLGKGVKKLSYYSYKLMTEKLEGSDWENIQETNPAPNVYVYRFINKQNNKPTYVAWWDYWNESNLQTKQVSIQIQGLSTRVKVTEAVPNYKNGLLLQQESSYPDFFHEDYLMSDNGNLNLTLGKNPIYIESNNDQN